MTAKQAKVNFGDLMIAMQREPVFITKNNKPVGAFISIQDLKHTDFSKRFIDETPNNDEWVKARLQHALQEFDNNGSTGVQADADFYDNMMNQVKAQFAK